MDTSQVSQIPDQAYYTIPQVMDLFHVGRTTVYRLMKKHGIDPVMISDRSPRLTKVQVNQMFSLAGQD